MAKVKPSDYMVLLGSKVLMEAYTFISTLERSVDSVDSIEHMINLALSVSDDNFKQSVDLIIEWSKDSSTNS